MEDDARPPAVWARAPRLVLDPDNRDDHTAVRANLDATTNTSPALAIAIGAQPLKTKVHHLTYHLTAPNAAFRAVVGVARASAISRANPPAPHLAKHPPTTSNDEGLSFDDRGAPAFGPLPPHAADMTDAYDGVVSLADARAALASADAPDSDAAAATAATAAAARRGRGGSADKRARSATASAAAAGSADAPVAWGLNPYENALYATTDARHWGVHLAQLPSEGAAALGGGGAGGVHHLELTVTVDLGPARALYLSVAGGPTHKLSGVLPESVRPWALLPDGATLRIARHEVKRGAPSIVPLPRPITLETPVPAGVRRRWDALASAPVVAAAPLVDVAEAAASALAADAVDDAWAELAAAEASVASGRATGKAAAAPAASASARNGVASKGRGAAARHDGPPAGATRLAELRGWGADSAAVRAEAVRSVVAALSGRGAGGRGGEAAADRASGRRRAAPSQAQEAPPHPKRVAVAAIDDDHASTTAGSARATRRRSAVAPKTVASVAAHATATCAPPPEAPVETGPARARAARSRSAATSAPAAPDAEPEPAPAASSARVARRVAPFAAVAAPAPAAAAAKRKGAAAGAAPETRARPPAVKTARTAASSSRAPPRGPSPRNTRSGVVLG